MAVVRPYQKYEREAAAISGARKGSDGPQSSQPKPGKPVGGGPAMARTVGGSGQRLSGNYKSTVSRNPLTRNDRGADQMMPAEAMKTSTIGSGQRLTGQNRPTADPKPRGQDAAQDWKPSGKGGS